MKITKTRSGNINIKPQFKASNTNNWTGQGGDISY